MRSPGASFVEIAGSGATGEAAAALLRGLGRKGVRTTGPDDGPPARAWAESGAMALTGRADGPPALAPGPVATWARAALEAFRALARAGGGDVDPELASLDGAALLGERAALLGLARRGATSPGGSCRLLRARDGWIAVQLARPDDAASLPAWLGTGPVRDPWDFAAERIAGCAADELVTRARLLGLPVAPLASRPPAPPPWRRIAARGRPRRAGGPPLVVDLSSLWAGPLCTHLLARAGARVVKVESARRPDGARAGPPAFFDLLHADGESVALDFDAHRDRERLARLVARADIVVESARPRALAQLGIDADALVRGVPGLTWVSLTGYGRREPGAQWVAFGDDAAVAAGLVSTSAGDDTEAAVGVSTSAHGAPLFCGDAIADPLTGLHAAVAALAAWQDGGGVLLDLCLRDVAAHAVCGPARSCAVRVSRTRRDAGDAGGAAFEIELDGERHAVRAPRARTPRGRARPLGADTAAVLRELAC